MGRVEKRTPTGATSMTRVQAFSDIPLRPEDVVILLRHLESMAPKLTASPPG